MEIIEGPLPGCFCVPLKKFEDARGEFVKTYSRSLFAEAGVSIDMQEEFYSLSQKGVIRGMHFQVPPHDHHKIVYCAQGAVEDVLLDLRRGSGYGSFRSIVLSADHPMLLFICKGVAHGFESLADGSLMVYKTSTEHVASHDRGIRWDSFGHTWKSESPILSERDRQHPPLNGFASPFQGGK